MMLAGNADLSSMLGWVSIACWIIVYSPQIYENYSLQSGEGLSVLFVVIWLLGDLSNLVGAALAHLLPTVIIIAVWYSLCDITLLVQVYYYRSKRARRSPEEETPLLPGNNGGNSPDIVSTRVLILRYTAALIFVFTTGVLAWWISRNSEKTEEPPKQPTATVDWTVQILGWSSAVLYLGSRIPQIAKNLQTQCEGLSPALFFFAIVGNLTYSLSIIAKSTEREYLILNASWLAGSALTVFLDLIVLGQFFWYRSLYVARQSAGGT
ncbi:PQ loop repeat-domain-containing protein [Mycena albidolilacea]|uniref:PQ loop repeat-domain-containing protein n=1 Tax=Mycena albidolilacea TaxID=1033008 RepID=A0AAD7ASH1_9AGAR|nr:PQ loop repeat-domain-containing protein [Mycena albidolilacea]